MEIFGGFSLGWGMDEPRDPHRLVSLPAIWLLVFILMMLALGGGAAACD